MSEASASGYAYRITWLDDGCECDEGWYWDDDTPWTRDQAVEAGRGAVARDIHGDGIDYILHVVRLGHGWPTDREPLSTDLLLDEAERMIVESDDCMVDESRGLWADIHGNAEQDLDARLTAVWHAWCLEHRKSIGVVRMLGVPEVVDARGVYLEDKTCG